MEHCDDTQVVSFPPFIPTDPLDQQPPSEPPSQKGGTVSKQFEHGKSSSSNDHAKYK